MKPIDIKIIDQRIKNNMKEYMSCYATPGSAGLDLVACISDQIVNIVLDPGEQVIMGTGLAIHLNDPGYAAMILPRSGLGSKGLVLANTVGLIDSDYQGELKVCLWNRTADRKIEITPMMRVAQLVIVPVIQAQFNVVEEFEQSVRGEGGFGSTWIN